MRDEDGPWFEIHPVDDLEVVSVPQATATPGAPLSDHLTPAPRTGAPGRFGYYTVKEGESLARIAEQFYGVQSWPVLARANPHYARYPDIIQPGWRLNIPIQTTKGLATTAKPNKG